MQAYPKKTSKIYMRFWIFGLNATTSTTNTKQAHISGYYSIENEKMYVIIPAKISKTFGSKMNKLHFIINDISAIISPNVDLPSLIASQKSQNPNTLDFTQLQSYKADFALSHLSPLERRRLSNASKCVFSLLQPKIKEWNLDSIPIVFSSTLGEINRCFSMLLSLQDSYLLSPTSFSMSVLNATPALLAIAHNNNAEISAISANPSLEYAMINAYMRLQEATNKEAKNKAANKNAEHTNKVLVLSYYEGLAREYLTYKAQNSNTPTTSNKQNPQKNAPDFLLLAAIVSLPNQPHKTDSETDKKAFYATLEINKPHTKAPSPNDLEIILSELDLLAATNTISKKDASKSISYSIDNDSFKWRIELQNA